MSLRCYLSRHSRPSFVIPAKAGTHSGLAVNFDGYGSAIMDPRLRGGDIFLRGWKI